MLTYVSSAKGTLPLIMKYKIYDDAKFTELTEEQFMDAKGNLILDKTIDQL